MLRTKIKMPAPVPGDVNARLAKRAIAAKWCVLSRTRHLAARGQERRKPTDIWKDRIKS
jgi:hypothetical protein